MGEPARLISFGTKLIYGTLVSTTVAALWTALTWDGYPKVQIQPSQWAEVVEGIKEREFAVRATTLVLSVSTQKIVRYLPDSAAPLYAIPNGSNAPTLTHYLVADGTIDIVQTNWVRAGYGAYQGLDMGHRTRGRQIGLRLAGVYDLITFQGGDYPFTLGGPSYQLAYDSSDVVMWLPPGADMHTHDGRGIVWVKEQYYYGYWKGSTTVSNAPGVMDTWGLGYFRLTTNVNVDLQEYLGTIEHVTDGVWSSHNNDWQRREGRHHSPTVTGLRTNHLISVPAYEWELSPLDAAYRNVAFQGTTLGVSLHNYIPPHLPSLGIMGWQSGDLGIAAAAIRALVPQFVSSEAGGSHIVYLSVSNLFGTMGIGDGISRFTGETNDNFGWRGFHGHARQRTLMEMYRVLSACTKTLTALSIASNAVAQTQTNMTALLPAYVLADGYTISIDNSFAGGSWTNIAPQSLASSTFEATASPVVWWYLAWGQTISNLYVWYSVNTAVRTVGSMRYSASLPDFPSGVSATLTIPAVTGNVVTVVGSCNFEGNLLKYESTTTTAPVVFSSPQTFDFSFDGLSTNRHRIISAPITFSNFPSAAKTIALAKPSTIDFPSSVWTWTKAAYISQSATVSNAPGSGVVEWKLSRCKP